MARLKKERNWIEAEIIGMFNLKRIVGEQTVLMQEWLSTPNPSFDSYEQRLFDKTLDKAVRHIGGWGEEDLKMKFISFILELSNLIEGERFVTFFEKTISAEIDGYFLSTKTDFMVASGILNLPKNPFFHFQEYKPKLNPKGEPMAQLLQAMLIAHNINNNEKPIYGCEIVGEIWRFVILENRTYCISKSYDCVDKNDLLQIISILRKFKDILETRLLD